MVGGRPQLAAALASARVDVEVAVGRLVLCTLVTLLMVHFVEKRDARVAATAQPTSQPTPTRLEGPQDEPMDVDPTPSVPPNLPAASSSSASREPLPFPGKLANGVRQVEYYNLYVSTCSPSLLASSR